MISYLPQDEKEKWMSQFVYWCPRTPATLKARRVKARVVGRSKNPRRSSELIGIRIVTENAGEGILKYVSPENLIPRDPDHDEIALLKNQGDNL